jgi:structural maintenance of chromosome 4
MTVLEREIKTAEKDLETLKQRSRTIETEITQLQNQILAVGGIELRKQQSKVDGINQMIELENDKVTKAEVGVNKARKDIEKHAKVWDTSQKELKDFEVVLEKLKADLQVIANDVASVRQLVKEAQDKFEEQKERLDVIKAELDEKLELTRSFRKRVVSAIITCRGRAQRKDRAK